MLNSTMLLRGLRFRLWHLFVAITFLGIVFAWFGYRWNYRAAEARVLAGEWVLLNDQGEVVYMGGKPLRITQDRNDFTIDPFCEPRQIDFQTPLGVSKGIYRWENGRVRVFQSSPGLERPHSFSSSITDLSAISAGDYSATTYILARP